MLGLDIQGGEHSSVEDAQAAMAVYRVCAKEWEERLRLKKLGVAAPAKVKRAKPVNE